MTATLEAPVEPVISFDLPPALEAHEPPELRGLRRDHVRMLVLPRGGGRVTHTRFDEIGAFLRPGDLLVANSSRTLPALLRATDETGAAVEVRLAHRRSADLWDVLLLDGRRHIGHVGQQLRFGGDLEARIEERRPDLPFLWRMRFNHAGLPLLDRIYRQGEPVRYSYVADALPVDFYQTVYATEPGSVEMPSAGRPFTWELLLRLRRQDVGFATLLLHTGLSSTRDDAIDALHPNYDEEYKVPAATAAAINRTRASGGRVIAVGTTVVRALETVAQADGTVTPGAGWTRLRIDAAHKLRSVDGLITGLHEPAASHLDLLSAFVAPEPLGDAYRQAVALGYLWHEFGDMNLIV